MNAVSPPNGVAESAKDFSVRRIVLALRVQTRSFMFFTPRPDGSRSPFRDTPLGG